MQIANLARKLEATGLTEKQAKVYVASLFLGAAPVQRIAEQAEVNRATTYVILDELMAMGFVSTAHEGKKNVYVPEPPEAIERYLDSIEKEVELRKTELKSVMKDLKEASRIEVEDAPIVRFYKGPEAALAVTTYLRRKSSRNSTVYSISDVDEVLKVFPELLKTNPKQRIKKNISSKLLYSGSIDVPTDMDLQRQTKRLPSKALGDVNIYDDRMTILSYRGDNSVGVVIESKEIVAVVRQLFELAWNNHTDSTK